MIYFLVILFFVAFIYILYTPSVFFTLLIIGILSLIIYTKYKNSDAYKEAERKKIENKKRQEMELYERMNASGVFPTSMVTNGVSTVYFDENNRKIFLNCKYNVVNNNLMEVALDVDSIISYGTDTKTNTNIQYTAGTYFNGKMKVNENIDTIWFTLKLNSIDTPYINFVCTGPEVWLPEAQQFASKIIGVLDYIKYNKLTTRKPLLNPFEEMATIKCRECGQEISDKATSCIHCGCPTNEKEIIIAKTIIDKEFINKCKKILGCVFGGFGGIWLYMLLSIDVESVVVIPFTLGLFFGLPYYCIWSYFNKRQNTELILTKKRIYGKCFLRGEGLVQIDFPLNQVSKIIIGNSKNNKRSYLTICSSSCTNGINYGIKYYDVDFVLNANEFGEAFYKEKEELQKLKKEKQEEQIERKEELAKEYEQRRELLLEKGGFCVKQVGTVCVDKENGKIIFLLKKHTFKTNSFIGITEKTYNLDDIKYYQHTGLSLTFHLSDGTTKDYSIYFYEYLLEQIPEKDYDNYIANLKSKGKQ